MKSGKDYLGRRIKICSGKLRGGPWQYRTFVQVDNGGTVNFLPLRLDLRSHSPSGFEWGYGGSGPAQLALAILCDYYQDDAKACAYYQQFKEAIIANITKADWVISGADIESAIAIIDRKNHEESND